MKKVQSLVLVLALMLCALPVAVFAADDPTNVDLEIGFSSNADMLDNSDVEDFGHLVVGKRLDSFRIPIKYKNFTAKPGTTITKEDVTQHVLNNLDIEFTAVDGSPKFTELFMWPPEVHTGNATAEPYFVITGKNIGKAHYDFKLIWKGKDGTKAVESDTYKMRGELIDPTINKHIKAIADHSIAELASEITINGKPIWSKSTNTGVETALGNLNIQPGDKLEIPLNTNHFIWDPLIKDMGASVRKATLDLDFIKAFHTSTKGRDMIESVQVENVDGYGSVVIRFKEDYPITEDKDLELQVGLQIKNKRSQASMVTLSGTFGNPVYEANEDNDLVFIGDGMVVEAQRFIRNIELDLDEGVSVFGNLVGGKRYYGKATTTPTNDDKDIMNYFPSIQKSISLNTTNIPSAAKHVELHEQTQYFVYDADGKYLGTSLQKLPFRTKYYLSAKQLNFDTDLDAIGTAPMEEGDYGEFDNPPTGGAYRSWSGFEVLGVLTGMGAVIIMYKLRQEDNQKGGKTDETQ